VTIFPRIMACAGVSVEVPSEFLARNNSVRELIISDCSSVSPKVDKVPFASVLNKVSKDTFRICESCIATSREGLVAPLSYLLMAGPLIPHFSPKYSCDICRDFLILFKFSPKSLYIVNFSFRNFSYT